ncbi:MAG TPA: hypothetical protein VMT19_13550 [Thermoanaerobaculaceae bacterium]|nr:hypothetical protein [Thermoanaerobaculaceae bacterium]
MLRENLAQKRSRAAHGARGPRSVRAGALAPIVLLLSASGAYGVAGQGPAPTPAPQPTPAPAVPARALSLNLDDVLARRERGHAEFDRAVQRVVWDDRMVRLASGVAREEAAARRGGLVGLPVPFTAGSLAGTMPGPGVSVVLAGPFAGDWHDLSPQEKVGRIAETAVTYGIIFEILRGLAESPR